MKLACLFFILLSLCGAGCGRNASADLSLPATVFRDSRIIQEASMLPLDQMAGDQKWGIIEIRPKPSIGFLLGWYIDGKTGNFHKRSDEPPIVYAHGCFKIAVMLSGTAPDFPGDFWKRPARLKPEVDTPPGFIPYYWAKVANDPDRNRHTPFEGTETGWAVVRFNDKPADAGAFRPVFLIPSDWQEIVVPALKSYAASKELFDALKVDENRSRLYDLLDDANPFLAAQAAHLLAETQSFDASILRDHLLKDRDLKQGILVYLALRQSASKLDETAKVIEAVIEGAPSSESVLGIVQGLAATCMEEGSSKAKVPARSLLAKVEAKLSAKQTVTPADEHLSQVLTVLGYGHPVAPVVAQPGE